MSSPATVVVLIITIATSWWAFRRPDWQERLMFNPFAILRLKQYDRMVTSGFIHLDWGHLLFNCFSFYAFGHYIEDFYGARTLLVIYFASIVGGSILSLIVHRNHDYRALGASGGVCGIIYASIFLLPGSGVRMLFVPIDIPGWVYAILYLAGSFWAHRKQVGNVGHDAHMGGAIIGLLIAAVMYPDMIRAAPWMFAIVLSLSIAILLILILDPVHLLETSFGRREEAVGDERSRRYAQNRARNRAIAEVDKLLDKVAQKGIHSLSDSERKSWTGCRGRFVEKKFELINHTNCGRGRRQIQPGKPGRRHSA